MSTGKLCAGARIPSMKVLSSQQCCSAVVSVCVIVIEWLLEYPSCVNLSSLNNLRVKYFQCVLQNKLGLYRDKLLLFFLDKLRRKQIQFENQDRSEFNVKIKKIKCCLLLISILPNKCAVLSELRSLLLVYDFMIITTVREKRNTLPSISWFAVSVVGTHSEAMQILSTALCFCRIQTLCWPAQRTRPFRCGTQELWVVRFCCWFSWVRSW